jgi:hypothetical protein
MRIPFDGLLGIALVGVALALSVSPAFAQKHLPADPVFCDPASNPLDAVRAAPDFHHVLFEDEHVRVLEIIIPAASVEPVHIHALPSVITGETGGGGGAKFLYIQFEMKDGKFAEVSRNEVSPTPGYRTVWSGPEGPHAIANIGPVSVSFMRIEMKPENCARN